MTNASPLTHFDAQGQAHMVDVGAKPATARRAREAAASIFVTGSFWCGAVAMASALATLRKLQALDGITHIQAMGQRLRDGLDAQARPAASASARVTRRRPAHRIFKRTLEIPDAGAEAGQARGRTGRRVAPAPVGAAAGAARGEAGCGDHACGAAGLALPLSAP